METSRILAAMLVLPAFLVTACGGEEPQDTGIASVPTTGSSSSAEAPPSSAAPSGKSEFYDAQLAFSQCMRKEGMKDWPDPKLSGYADMPKMEKIQGQEVEKDGQKELQRVMAACGELMQKAAQLEPKKDQQKVFESLMAHAQCMRAQGVTKFANPTMQGGQAIPGGDPNPTSPQIDVNSPAYEAARKACEDKLIEQAAGMQ
ncbi:hypothetical protein AB5J62_32925 [Amycolatopsis sp. cg5]|uniref:hypothetical protein n=1 Tax=Amycolatopsis sp. cg5 TaxID=3238802 RepID=UPI0035261B9B